MSKRFIICIATLLVGLMAEAQPFELGFISGTSVNGTCQIDMGADIAYQFSPFGSLEIGFGAGLRYARPLHQEFKSIHDGIVQDVEITFSNELALPIFARVRYTIPKNIFFQVDAGYRFALINMVWWYPEKTLSGEFFEPQIGYRFDQRRSLSIGASLQHCPRIKRYNISSGSGESYSSWGEYERSKIWRPVAFIKYAKTL